MTFSPGVLQAKTQWVTEVKFLVESPEIRIRES